MRPGTWRSPTSGTPDSSSRDTRRSDRHNRSVTPGEWSAADESVAVWPGRNWPLGATWGEESTNFAVYAPDATAVWVCLFDDERQRDPARADRAQPGHLARRAARARSPASATASGPTGRGTPNGDCASTRTSCCSTPTRARSAASSAPTRRSSASRPVTTCGPRTTPHVLRRARLRAVRRPQRRRPRRLRLGRRPEDRRPVARHRDLRAARQGLHQAARPDPRGAARHVRRARSPAWSPTTSTTSA